MNFTIYNLTSGQIIQSGYCQDISIQPIPNGCGLLPIESNPLGQYIQDDLVVDMPDRPSLEHVFNYVTKSWEIDLNTLKESIIAKRNGLLYKSDWTQLPNGPLTSAQQNLWSIYRQNLRDIPAQAGYPTNIVWPTEP